MLAFIMLLILILRSLPSAYSAINFRYEYTNKTLLGRFPFDRKTSNFMYEYLEVIWRGSHYINSIHLLLCSFLLKLWEAWFVFLGDLNEWLRVKKVVFMAKQCNGNYEYALFLSRCKDSHTDPKLPSNFSYYIAAET